MARNLKIIREGLLAVQKVSKISWYFEFTPPKAGSIGFVHLKEKDSMSFMRLWSSVV